MFTAVAVAAALAVEAPPQLAELGRVWTQQYQAAGKSRTGSVQLTTSAPAAGCVPVAVSGTAVVYNILVAGDLKLSRDALKNILEGRITRYDDPQLAAANPGAVLPKAPILLALPPDDALAPLRQLYGSLTPSPAAKRLANEDAVAKYVSETDNAFSVVDAAHARRSSLLVAAVTNKAGNFVTPNARSVSRAAVGVKLPEDLRASIVDAQGADSYPLATLVYGCSPDRAFLAWALHDGQKSVVPLGFAPLPGFMVLLASERAAK